MRRWGLGEDIDWGKERKAERVKQDERKKQRKKGKKEE
jgi:hypothetical protein